MHCNHPILAQKPAASVLEGRDRVAVALTHRETWDAIKGAPASFFVEASALAAAAVAMGLPLEQYVVRRRHARVGPRSTVRAGHAPPRCQPDRKLRAIREGEGSARLTN